MEKLGGLLGKHTRWADAVCGGGRTRVGSRVLGVLPGEGIGPEVIGAALSLLPTLEAHSGARLDVRFGGAIGREAELLTGRPLTDEVVSFCEGVFSDGGAILAGPGSGRFVYELRKRFDLFCKISPLRPWRSLRGPSRRRTDVDVDILVVRENVEGIYQGEWQEIVRPGDGRICEHTFRYSERGVRRILEVAAALARRRRGELAVVVKEGGIPGITGLWRDVAQEVAASQGVRACFQNIDLAAYRLVREPEAFDVVVASNLFGDVLSDVGALLLGSRALAFSGNFSPTGAAVYQTNHGAALDIAGRHRANPIGQIAALGMMLRESLDRAQEAEWIDEGIEEVLRLGFRTFDIAEEGATVVGTEQMAQRIAASLERLARSHRE